MQSKRAYRPEAQMIVKRGEYYHYQFQIDGKRYRGSTKSTNKAEALRSEAERRMACLRNPEQSIGPAENLNSTWRSSGFWPGPVPTSNQERTSDIEFQPNDSSPTLATF